MPFSRRVFLATTVATTFAGAEVLAGGGAPPDRPAGMDAGTQSGASAQSSAAAAGAGAAAGDVAKFRAAVAAGDVAAVEAAIERDRALLYARDDQDRSMFAVAMHARQQKVAELFLAKGLTLDIFDAAVAPTSARLQKLLTDEAALIYSRARNGATPLQVAAAAGNPDSTELLAFRGSWFEPAAFGDPLPTPLYYAVGHKDAEAAERMTWAIAGNNADPNAPQPDGHSILHAAAAAGHVSIVELLLRRGANADARDREGLTPREVARRAGHQQVAQLLANAPKVQRNVYTSRYERNAKGEKVVREDRMGLPQNWINQFVTLAHFNLAQVRTMCERCPDLALARASFDELAVEASAHVGMIDGVKYLLDKNAPLSICTATMLGMTAEVNRMLADDPARAHERGPHDLPLFFYPAFGKPASLELAQRLVKAGADPKVEMRGLTALHLAARLGQADLVEWLLSQGLDPNQESRHQMGRGRPLSIALKQEHAAVADLLRTHGAQP